MQKYSWAINDQDPVAFLTPTSSVSEEIQSLDLERKWYRCKQSKTHRARIRYLRKESTKVNIMSKDYLEKIMTTEIFLLT